MFYVHRVEGLNLVEIHRENITALSTDYTYTGMEIIVQHPYLAVIYSGYSPSHTLIRVYHNTGEALSFIRSYARLGGYVRSRALNGQLLVLAHTPMYLNQTYTWNVSDAGIVNESVWQGTGENGSPGTYVRSLARIPLAHSNDTSYRFAAYTGVDFAYVMLLTPAGNVYIPSDKYLSNTIQKVSIADVAGTSWGASSWALFDGRIYNSYQMQEHGGNFLAATSQPGNQSNSYTTGLQIIKIPISNFSTASKQVTNYVIASNEAYLGSRWNKELLYINIFPNITKVYSTSMNSISGRIENPYTNTAFHPYGPTHWIGPGFESNNAVIGLFEAIGAQLYLRQYIVLTANSNSDQSSYNYTYTSTYEFGAASFELDWTNKRVTLPLSTSNPEPFRNGYLQLYINPPTKCLSLLPVPASCSSPAKQTVNTFGKVFKHWDETENNDYLTGYSETTSRASTITQGPNKILLTSSYCQLQARIIKPPTDAVVYEPNATNSGSVVAIDLCSY